ncbi:MAG: UvrD-helicase domain-containing protein [Nitrosomonas sp.]|nr:UvrD-helicase domain-containing protein [Nitrosomonas sp.]
MPSDISDQPQRLQALDPLCSFIVQAPAGSGKTGLLTQRFLALLGRVDEPEEIIAITFTRKAAAEMQHRIMQALRDASEKLPAEDEFVQQTRQLACGALVRDQERGWQLLDNPARLRIQTIDSLCAWLVGQMPVVSGKGVLSAVTENADELYLEAARLTLLALEDNNAWSPAISHLVQHLDNRLDRLQRLIADMLARRDQWLRHITSIENTDVIRNHLEQALVRRITSVLHTLTNAVPADLQREIIELARFAADQLQDQPGKNSIDSCHMLLQWPGSELRDCPLWAGIADLLLTQEGTWRKQVNIKQGFPPSTSAKDRESREKYTQAKQRMLVLLSDLQQNESFRQQLCRLRELPPAQYEPAEWETLQALFTLLKVATAHLVMVFQQAGVVDFCEITLAAIHALGTPEEPTDLALALDYRISHLLVDEFQDTSFNQAQLLHGLTAGWQVGDGRTLFLVGDPMQSIYRFRQAEVGLFLDICQRGCFGQIPIHFLHLTVNFRSQSGIVDWVNQHFSAIFPAANNVATGAVTYTAATAFHPAMAGEAVSVNASLQKDDPAEAAAIVTIVQQTRQQYPHGKIGILVRNRAHLPAITTSLRHARLRFQAVEIERLARRPVIRDLNALTRALLHSADRIAWLTVLRAPFCGFSLNDLHTLVQADLTMTVMDCLSVPPTLAGLSEDGQQRLERVQPILASALSLCDRIPLRASVEGTWLQLGGPACVTDNTDLPDIEVYFELLQKLEETGVRPDVQMLDDALARLFASPDTAADDSLQIMTLHKAKGLEFDTVILPGLGKSPRRDREKLLNWAEFSTESGVADLMCAPISAPGDDKDPISAYIMTLEKEKTSMEDARLLYVAVTRARNQLYLLGQIAFDADRSKDGIPLPPANTLLAKLWPAVEKHFLAEHHAGSNDAHQYGQFTVSEQQSMQIGHARLVADWQTLPPPETWLLTKAEVQAIPVIEPIDFNWAGETARLIGVTLHRLLQHIGQIGIENVTQQDLVKLTQQAPILLRHSGIAPQQTEIAAQQIKTALDNICSDARGRWILSNQHVQARCEWALSVTTNRTNTTLVMIDRTFIDAAGIRWIIDYKTGTHTGSDVEAFLDQEQRRYLPQLTRYATILQKMENRPIRLGLYFPLLTAWREWRFSS